MFRIAVLDDYAQVAHRMADWSALQGRAEIVFFDQALAPDEAVRALQDFDAVSLLRERMAFPRSLIERLPRLKCIAITGPRNRTLDIDAARDRGIVVCSATGAPVASGATVELSWGLILSAARQLPAQMSRLRAGGWQGDPGHVLRGRTLGVLGLGRLGAQMVPIAQAFGMTVIAWSPNLTDEKAAACGALRVSREALFEQSDYLSLHLVLSERSAGLVGAADLARMKPTAWLINTSRAGLVEADALWQALQERRLGGAALDVYDIEPLPLSDRFRALDQVIMTPHLGYYVVEQLEAFYQGTVRNLVAFLDGQPINRV
ncbi:MAG: hypothetical protein RL322_1769 [Pseudomonadota bacterium]|jgi:D-3-phosphoglycerate dehydrogenase